MPFRSVFLSVVLIVAMQVSGICAAGPVAPPDVSVVAGRELDVALDLCSRAVPTGENSILSPYVIASGLAMLYAGARGTTEAEMARALRFDLPQDRLHAAIGAIEDSLASMQARELAGLELGRAMWIQEGSVPMRPEYLALVAQSYHPEIRTADFFKSAPAAWAEIDRWAAERTHGRQSGVGGAQLPEVPPTIVQVTTAYLDAEWARPFDVDAESQIRFFVRPDSVVAVPYMSQTRGFPYYATAAVRIVELPYKESKLSMLVLLPTDRYGLAELERELSGELLNAWVALMEPWPVKVSMPRFTLRDRLDLEPPLTSMGMPCAFQRGCADFSGMIGAQWYKLMIAGHDAWITVDERGTEAAATLVLDVDAPPELPPLATEFRVDHPFLFLVRDRSTGAVLFLGRVVDPSTCQVGGTRSN